MMAPLAYVMFGVLATTIALPLARLPATKLTAIMRAGAILSVCGTAALVGLSALATRSGVDPDDYLVRLPKVGTLAAVPEMSARSRVVESRVGSLIFTRRCEDECDLDARPVGAPPRAASAAYHSTIVPAATLVVLHDASHDLWILPIAHGHQVIFNGAAGRLREVGVAGLRGSLRPPTGWTVGGALGLLIAAVAWTRRHLWVAAARRQAWRQAATPGGPGAGLPPTLPHRPDQLAACDAFAIAAAALLSAHSSPASSGESFDVQAVGSRAPKSRTMPVPR